MNLELTYFNICLFNDEDNGHDFIHSYTGITCPLQIISWTFLREKKKEGEAVWENYTIEIGVP